MEKISFRLWSHPYLPRTNRIAEKVIYWGMIRHLWLFSKNLLVILFFVLLFFLLRFCCFFFHQPSLAPLTKAPWGFFSVFRPGESLAASNKLFAHRAITRPRNAGTDPEEPFQWSRSFLTLSLSLYLSLLLFLHSHSGFYPEQRRRRRIGENLYVCEFVKGISPPIFISSPQLFFLTNPKTPPHNQQVSTNASCTFCIFVPLKVILSKNDFI